MRRAARSRSPGGQGGRGTAVRWIVDPLDGTVNYLYGLPDWAVSIAAEVDGTVVAGAVFVPRRDELYSARPGTAWLSCAPDWRGEDPAPGQAGLQPRRAARPARWWQPASGTRRARRVVQGDVLRPCCPRSATSGAGGSAAVDLCSVASGTVDAYYERGVNLWDIAAGGLIAAEAGARVTGLHGRPPSP